MGSSNFLNVSDLSLKCHAKILCLFTLQFEYTVKSDSIVST